MFRFVRRTYTSPTLATPSLGLGLVVAGSNGLHYNQVEGAIREDGSLGTVRWNQNWVLNSSDPTRILIGTDFLYELTDRGDTLVALGGLTKNANDHWMPANAIGEVSAYAYGHNQNPNVIYVGAAGSLLLRSSPSGLPQAITTYPGGPPVGISLDSNDWRRAYVLDAQGRVFRTNDAGSTAAGWSELTGDLPRFTGDVRSIVLMPRAQVSGREVIFVAGYGGVYVTENVGNGRFAMWRKHGTNFPNAVVTQIQYSPTDDILIAGTFGRSAWALPNTSATLLNEPTVNITSNQKGSCILGWVEGTNVELTATIQGGAALNYPLSIEWTFAGAVAKSPVTNFQVTVQMPVAGTEVA